MSRTPHLAVGRRKTGGQSFSGASPHAATPAGPAWSKQLGLSPVGWLGPCTSLSPGKYAEGKGWDPVSSVPPQQNPRNKAFPLVLPGECHGEG